MKNLWKPVPVKSAKFMLFKTLMVKTHTLFQTETDKLPHPLALGIPMQLA